MLMLKMKVSLITFRKYNCCKDKQVNCNSKMLQTVSQSQSKGSNHLVSNNRIMPIKTIKKNTTVLTSISKIINNNQKLIIF